GAGGTEPGTGAAIDRFAPRVARPGASPAASLLGRVPPDGHSAARPTSADVVADDQVRPAVAVQVAGRARQVVARLRLQYVGHELPLRHLFQNNDCVQAL